MKDVTFPDNPVTKTLLLEKHADYIVAFEKDKDDLVCVLGRGQSLLLAPLSLPFSYDTLLYEIVTSCIQYCMIPIAFHVG